MFETLLVANRGEIARRILRTAAALGVRTVAIHADADATLPFVREADEAVLIGPARPDESYLDPARVLEAVQRSGADAIHPGYGLLAGDPSFATAVIEAGLAWVGPPPEVLAATAIAREGPPAPIGVQVLGLDDGTVVALGERFSDGTVVESPAPALTEAVRDRIVAESIEYAHKAGIRNAATVRWTAGGEYAGIVAQLTADHPVTELGTGVDLVAEQLRLAAGDEPGDNLIAKRTYGFVVQVNIAATSTGTITEWAEPASDGERIDGVRVDAGYAVDAVVSPGYDPLLAKVCAVAATREAAIRNALEAVAAFTIRGVDTNLPFLAETLTDRMRT